MSVREVVEIGIGVGFVIGYGWCVRWLAREGWGGPRPVAPVIPLRPARPTTVSRVQHPSAQEQRVAGERR